MRRVHVYVCQVTLWLGLCWPAPGQASWWQDAKDKVHAWSEVVEARFESADSQSPSRAEPWQQDDPLVVFARERHWSLTHVIEPVFNSELSLLDSAELNKPALLLVHGLGAHAAQDWLPTLPGLAEQFRVIAIDLPGFGRSAQPAGDYSPANYAALLHWLVLEKHIRPHLLGHSMGGAVALYAAAKRPELFTSLSLVDAAGILERTAFVKSLATGPIPLDQLPEQIKARSYSAVDFAGALIEQVSLLGDPSEVLNQRQIRELALGKSPTAKAALALAQTDFSDLPEDLPLPMYILWGDADRVAPLRTGYMLRATFPESELSILPDAGHVPMATHSEEVVRWIQGTLLEPSFIDRFRWQPRQPSGEMLTLALAGCPNTPLSGAYARLSVKDCAYLEIRDATIGQLLVKDSVVKLDNVLLAGSGVVLEANESVLIGTGLTIHTEQAMKVSGSRIDWAGASITSKGDSFQVSRKSLFVFSICKAEGAGGIGKLHGSFRAEKRRF
ncbi:alpha/beta hydrolase [Simiduia agarivorans]|uniref:Alpha/beta hydrolase fold protein n=1 Tax=Simiduia agarivorans (strain DSM 21679 / JCM 13881 / BCRC 17597 / SA1) TaxID=1117647 RepID=K4KWL7_SIMAS|nr:alpha/beta hydrolase [Simiduia agarivorans]AFU98322.1 alpha/beta hydrolase fold protein [Simiduia agarivorans SA1 = DSM 21679]